MYGPGSGSEVVSRSLQLLRRVEAELAADSNLGATYSCAMRFTLARARARSIEVDEDGCGAIAVLGETAAGGGRRGGRAGGGGGAGGGCGIPRFTRSKLRACTVPAYSPLVQGERRRATPLVRVELWATFDDDVANSASLCTRSETILTCLATLIGDLDCLAFLGSPSGTTDLASYAQSDRGSPSRTQLFRSLIEGYLALRG